MKLRTLPLCACFVLPVAACAGMTAATISGQVVNDLHLIDTGLAALTPGLATIPGITPAEIAKVTADLTQAETVAGTINATVTADQAQPVVAQVEADVNAAVGILAGLPLPAGVSAGLKAAQVLLPVIEAGIGMVVPSAAAPGGMTPDQARAVLAGH